MNKKLKYLICIFLILFPLFAYSEEEKNNGTANAVCSPKGELHAYFVFKITGQKVLLKLNTFDEKGNRKPYKCKPEGAIES